MIESQMRILPLKVAFITQIKDGSWQSRLNAAIFS